MKTLSPVTWQSLLFTVFSLMCAMCFSLHEWYVKKCHMIILDILWYLDIHILNHCHIVLLNNEFLCVEMPLCLCVVTC